MHIGQNIARIRGMKRQTQKEIAAKLELSQSEYSRIEQKEQVDDDLLHRIAAALEVTPEIIREFREEAIFTNNIYDQNSNINQVYFQFNSIEKIIELYDEKVALLERLLQSEREKNELLANSLKKNS